MNNPGISVIIPTYNTAQFIVDAIESVLSQTFQDFEVVIADDGSTDNTSEVVKPFVDKYPDRIRYFYKKNGGEGSARNYGIKRAKGNYLAFLDSDDLWYPEKLERSYKALQEQPEYGIVCHGYRQTYNGQYGGDFSVNIKYNKFSQEDFLREFYLQCRFSIITVMMKKDIFYKVGGFDESFAALTDYDFWMRCAMVSRVLFLGEILAEYRKRGGSILSNVEQQLQYGTRFMEKHIKLFPEKERDKLRKQKLKNLYLTVAMGALDFKNPALARRYLLESLKISPINRIAIAMLLCVLISRNPLPLILRLRRLQASILRSSNRLLYAGTSNRG